MSKVKTLGADICYSPDESIWYAVLWILWRDGTMSERSGMDSPEFETKSDCETWAKNIAGCTRFLYPDA